MALFWYKSVHCVLMYFLGRFPLDKKVSTTISFVLEALLQISWFVLDKNFHTKKKTTAKFAIIDKYENPKKQLTLKSIIFKCSYRAV